ncbi:cytochrome c oxidase subunit I [Rhodopirellula halodulae]|uniref:cytochrome c oxidase subunit I n=1 Tax=Rhodopirellula halodulae TaxID=2894198 RepID=UPI001E3FB5B1|nr:cytochrome c oxidase subunit I [Rhodopirellula sp. JC737]MCC9658383.1 cytochrome c oxidase subunit I [Rhodopirellula sp. JC737]
MNDARESDLERSQARRLLKAWETPRGWRYWSAVNNSEVGLWYTLTAFAFFLFGGVLALVMRIQLAVPENDWLTHDQYNQIFTMHGSVMMFLFAVPILEAISIMLLPEMLGARDLPFPRLSAYGYWCFLIGGVFVCGSLFFDAAPRGGWFMYPPMTTQYQDGIGVDVWLLGLSFIEIASIAAAVELIVGVLKCRPPGMRLNLIPLYAWYILVVAVMILFAFPPLIAGDVLMELERAMDWPFFDVSRGGDPMLWQHLFWIFGHPEVYIVFLPSIALVAMMVPTFARTPMAGYGWIVLAAVGTGFLSFGLWVHHMFTTGIPGISIGIFSAASEAVAIPTGVQIFCFIATLLIGRVKRAVCLQFVLAGLATFIIGGLTGVMVAIAPFDYQAHDTYFIVGHLHYVLVGGTIFPIVAGFYYYYPFVTGKRLSERLGNLAFWLMLIGFNVAFFPMHLSGLIGMPRRVATYPSGMGLEIPNIISSIGAFVLGLGFVVLLWDVFRPKSKQPLVRRNVWDAGTLEWSGEVPDQPWGIRSIPIIQSRYPLWEQKNLLEGIDRGKFYLPDAEEGRRETLVTSAVDAELVHCLRVPGPSFLPFWAAVFTGGVFIFSTYHWWTAAGVCAVMSFCTIVTWLWTGTAEIPEKPTKSVGMGQSLPLYVSGPSAVGWWAMFITMLGDMTAFMSLVFGYFFYWTVHEEFPPAEWDGAEVYGPGTLWPMVGVALGIMAWCAVILARKSNRSDRSIAFYGAAIIGIVCSLLSALALFYGPYQNGMDPTQHVYTSSTAVLLLWTILHLVLGGVMLAYCIARRIAGRMDRQHDADLANVTLAWHFIALTTVITGATVALFPWVA